MQGVNSWQGLQQGLQLLRVEREKYWGCLPTGGQSEGYAHKDK